MIPVPPQGLTWLTPFLYVQNVKKALDFYSNIMGFEIIFKASDTEACEFARLRYHNINFTLNKEGFFDYQGVSPQTSHCTTPISFYLYHENIDWFFNKIKPHIKVIQEPRNEWWGDKKCRIEDPFGYIWEIATPFKTI